MRQRPAVFGLLLLLAALSAAGCHQEELQALQAENERLRDELDAAEQALREAKDQILQAQSDIQDAQSAAYTSCDYLQQVVLGMEEPEEVSR